MPISFQFGLRTSVWIGPVDLDASIGQILWCVWVEEVGRHFRHAFQVRDTSLKRNTVVEMFAAFSVGSFVLVQFRPVGVGGSSSLPVGVGGPMAIACKPSLSNCRGVAAFRPRPSVNSSPGYRGPNCVE